MAWTPLPDHEERACELDALGRFRWAHLVRECGKPIGPGTLFRCRVRCCPTCARDEANRRSAVMARRIKAMAFPILTEFKLVVPLKGLGGALDAIRDALACLRRRKCLASIPSATGAFHAAPLGARAWTAHCHVVFDAGDMVEDDDDLAEWAASVDAQFARSPADAGRSASTRRSRSSTCRCAWRGTSARSRHARRLRAATPSTSLMRSSTPFTAGPS